MAVWFVVLLFSVGALLLFVAGLSLTLMIKGRNMDGEISTNRHMRALGITCAVKDAVEADNVVSECSDICGERNCATCASDK